MGGGTIPIKIARAMQKASRNNKGFGLIDALTGVVLFALIALSLYQAYFTVTTLIVRSTIKAAATAILVEQVEVIRNLRFEDVGLIGGIPPGILPQDSVAVRNDRNYNVHLTVRNVDDPFDGSIGGAVADVSLQYSAQVDVGGLTMQNNSTIEGNVFSNGDVLGDTSTEITGSAWAANGNEIRDFTIGDDAHANSISNSTIGGDAYYQTITNSTVSGVTYPGSADPQSQSLPITQSQIDAWKSEAAAGGEIGSYNLQGNDTAQLGPVRINGNLELYNQARLTMTGTVWVTGNVLMRNSSVIELDPSYSSASGVLIVDGAIDLDNSVVACGSEGFNAGTNACNPANGSFLMYLSTNSSLDTASPAILMKNATEFKGILYAKNGLIYVKNNARLIEATGYAVRVEEGAQITYGTGLYSIFITGNPGIGDTSPADYKLVEVSVSCSNCQNFKPMKATTTVAPKALETSAGNGALFIRVINANGQPVAGAFVHVENSTLNPAISFDEITDGAGWLRLVDVPPALESYEITITKPGYTTDRSYLPGDPNNPNPIKPHVTVIADAVTQSTFYIDLVSTLNISTVNNICAPIPNVDFSLTGSKLIGVDPNILKYQQNHVTDGDGTLNISTLEWDTYSIAITDPGYYLAGALPSTPMALAPGSQNSLTMRMAPQTSNALLVEVKDGASQLPVAQATASLTGPGYANTLETGEGHFRQTDWSGGGGQDIFGDFTRYVDASPTLDTANPAGELKLSDQGGSYAPNGWLVSSSFDNSTSTNYYHLTIRPQDQPVLAGTDPVRVQIASNDDNTAWVFIGPDGTPGSYYTPSDRTLHASHSDDRYIRYRIELSTADTSVTPNVSDVAISFAAACAPSGQVYFDDVGTGEYTVSVTKNGYQSLVTNFSVSSGWNQKILSITPLP